MTPKIKWGGGGAVLAGIVAAIIAVGPGGGGPGVTTCPLPAFPDSSCTGVPAGTTLTSPTLDGEGNLQVLADYAVIDSVDVTGCIVVKAVGVTVKNSKMHCITTSGARPESASYPRLTVKDSTIDCSYGTSDANTGIFFENMNVLRADISHCENGLDMYRNVTLKDSYLHDLEQCVHQDCTDPVTHADEVHTDAIQSADGSNDIFEHNRIEAWTDCPYPTPWLDGRCNATSAININHGLSSPITSRNVTIRDNLLSGGAITLYCPRVPTENFVVERNRFSTVNAPRVGAFGAYRACDDDEIWVGNVNHETGEPMLADDDAWTG